MTENPIVRLDHVGLYYSRRSHFFRSTPFWALEDVSLELCRGETLGVIGRNGAGKSTLLRILAGILKPDRGSIYIEKGIFGSLLSLQVGFVPYLTGRENLVLSGLLLGASKREIKQKMDTIIDYSEIASFIDEPLRTYSTGMKARLGFSIAIHMEPPILLIDEVLGVGDADFAAKSLQSIKDRILSDQTVVIVSHNTNFMKQVCQRLLWVEDGVSLMQGPTEAVLEQYLAKGGTVRQLKKNNA
ncbi:MAG: ABC transporter ATP-binding protein [Acidobacteria bacterium]|nr:ABC transporter ATP-binding protein [Acidobacteriota bacterium]MCB9397320.1 ABC transporter ATP-binding protein [Acidobacteriota bacterium]